MASAVATRSDPVVAPVWPPVVTGGLRCRRGELARSARGRVLDLGEVAPHLHHYAAAGVSSVSILDPGAVARAELQCRADTLTLDLRCHASLDDATSDGPFDTVVSVLALARRPDLPGTLAAIAGVLAPEGRLELLEPVMQPGPLGLVLTPLSSLVPGVAGLHLNRAVPSAVRAQGLTIIAIERFIMPTVIWPLRLFARATARPRVGVRP